MQHLQYPSTTVTLMEKKTEGKAVTNLTLICFKFKIHPCDLPFLTSTHNTTNI